MIKSLDIIGIDIISIKEGKKVASVKDIIYDQGSQKVLAILLDEGSIFTDPHIIRLSDVKEIGRDALMIESAGNIYSAADVDETIRTIAKDKIFLTQTKMITTSGEKLGRVSDIYFDPHSGLVQEFEITQDGMNKRKIKIKDIVSVGEDATVVKAKISDISAPDLIQPVQEPDIWQQMNRFLATPIKTLLRSAADKSKLEDSNRDNYQLFAHDITKTDKSAKTSEQFNQQVNFGNDERKKQNAIGKYLTKTILSRNDEVLGKRGDMITNKLIAAAEKEGLIDQVIKNTTEEPLIKEP